MKIIYEHVKMGMYFKSFEMKCDHLHGPPLSWDYNCVVSVSPSY